MSEPRHGLCEWAPVLAHFVEADVTENDRESSVTISPVYEVHRTGR